MRAVYFRRFNPECEHDSSATRCCDGESEDVPCEYTKPDVTPEAAPSTIWHDSYLQLHFVLIENPCLPLSSNPNASMVYQYIADMTGGLVFTVDNTNVQSVLMTIYYYFGYDAVKPRVILDYGSRTMMNMSYQTSFVVDPQLTEISICATGCSPTAAFIRDNRGKDSPIGGRSQLPETHFRFRSGVGS